MKTQELFESLWFHEGPEPLEGMRADGAWIQYHTATWCKACKALDTASIVKAAEKKGLTVWKIDADENDYTSGYCGVRSIPTWQFCKPRKIVSTVQSNNTDTILQWLEQW